VVRRGGGLVRWLRHPAFARAQAMVAAARAETVGIMEPDEMEPRPSAIVR
jgi:hypothetical protein